MIEIMRKVGVSQREYKVGDIVFLRNPGRAYSTYSEFFSENKIDPEIAARYQYGSIMGDYVEVGTKMRVVATGMHKLGFSMLVVQTLTNSSCWLIDEAGVEPEALRYNLVVEVPFVVNAARYEEAVEKVRREVDTKYGFDEYDVKWVASEQKM